MKFPVVTVTLVAGALLYVLWSQYQEPSAPVEPASFTDLTSNPAKRSDVVDLVIGQIPELCSDAVSGPEAITECVKLAESRTSSCRRVVYDNFPDNVASDAVFRDASITMMNCLVRQSGVVQP